MAATITMAASYTTPRDTTVMAEFTSYRGYRSRGRGDALLRRLHAGQKFRPRCLVIDGLRR